MGQFFQLKYVLFDVEDIIFDLAIVVEQKLLDKLLSWNCVIFIEIFIAFSVIEPSWHLNELILF